MGKELRESRDIVTSEQVLPQSNSTTYRSGSVTAAVPRHDEHIFRALNADWRGKRYRFGGRVTLLNSLTFF